MQDSTRILVVDDHALFRESLVRLLESEPDLQVVAHCESIAAAKDILSRTAVDMVLLDYDLGEESGAALIRDLQKHSDRIRVLVVTAGTCDAATAEMLKAGAAGVFYKHRQPAQLLEAIRKVLQGELWLDSDVLRSLIASTQGRAREEPRQEPLTLRQQQVLSGVLGGLSNKEIAWKLQISATTIKTVVHELFEMAHVRTRGQLVRVALQEHAADWLASDKVWGLCGHGAHPDQPKG
jgi:DNA-binding NarL/FixJ family response regulator